MDFNNKNLKFQYKVLKLLYVLSVEGFPLSEAMPILLKRYPDLNWESKLEKGLTFEQILQEDHFDNDAILVFNLSLKSSNLEKALFETLLIIENKVKRRDDFLEVIKYPLMLVLIASAAVLFVVLFLIPQFSAILQSMNAYTGSVKIIFSVFKIMPYILCFIIVIAGLSSYYIYHLSAYERFKIFVRFKPTKKFYLAFYNQVFVINLTNLLRTNMHLSDVLIMLSKQEQNYILAHECKLILKGLEEGKLISQSLTPEYYEPELIHLIMQGETTGMLEYHIHTYSEMLKVENDEKTKKFIFLIQPIFYCIFGLLILALYAAIFIPMFNLMDSI